MISGCSRDGDLRGILGIGKSRQRYPGCNLVRNKGLDERLFVLKCRKESQVTVTLSGAPNLTLRNSSRQSSL